ncbi:hypothetical protein EJ02DRAFT_417570 [Clathrospora elynae]|uniref:Uncharacterized protein n=1 Tax=Clathrospora elynae TaxID=706981 RepID=A0A6A5T6R9_9PLEO|nr:hypothetical protein EJ02DRAFT_417570 [Clathrospora elynae]
MEHWYANCFILNPRHPRRPRSYQPAADLIRKVEQARKDPKINARIKTALERWAARQPQDTRTLQVDDGKLPADSSTFVVSNGPLLMTLSSHGSLTPPNKNNNVITIDACTQPAGALTVMAMDNTNQAELLN